VTAESTPERERGTDLDALARRSELLFTQDARGRLLRVRETDGPVAPRFYLARSPLGNVWRLRADLPREVVVALARLAGREPPLPAPSTWAGADCAPPERVEAFREVLRPHGPIVHEYRGPAFRFPALITDGRQLGTDGEQAGLEAGRLDATRLDAQRDADRALLMKPSDPSDDAKPEGLALAWLANPSQLLPQTDCFAIVRGGGVVSACWTSRFLQGVGAEAGVATIASQRGKGYAPIVVAAWARAMRDSGVEPHYSTEWTNKESRAVARRLGLILCGEDLHFG
jgi:hypothetical protein